MMVDVLVIGSGPTGLALAQGLRAADISCAIVEKHESLDAYPRDWSFALHWGAAALELLLPKSLYDRLPSIQVDSNKLKDQTDYIKIVNGQSGETLSSIPIKSLYQFSRRKLRALLAEGLDIQFHKKLKSIEYSKDEKWTTSLFEDGTSIVSKLVIGADGAHSTVRQLLLGLDQSAVRHLPYCATFVQAQFPPQKAQFLRSFFSLYLAGVHPSNKYGFFGMQDGADPKHPETWTFFFYISWPSPVKEQNQTANWSNTQRLRQVKELAKDFTDPWKSAFSWLPDEHDVWHICLTDFDLAAEKHRWNNHEGRVTLAGDAAHAMTTQRGQGLNHSMTDAANLCKAIKHVMAGTGALDREIKSYELEMVARAGEEVRVSALNTEMLHNWNMALGSPMLMSGLEANTVHVSV